jgi:hypothetical protein
MRSYNFFRLIYNKVTSRSDGYLLKFSYFYFLRNWFFQLCQKLQSLVRKTQGILGVTNPTKAYIYIFLSFFWNKLQISKAFNNTNHIKFLLHTSMWWNYVKKGLLYSFFVYFCGTLIPKGWRAWCQKNLFLPKESCVLIVKKASQKENFDFWTL